MKKPCRLEWNNSGAWKLLGKFDAGVEDSTDDILNAASLLVEALNAPYSGREALTTMRVSTDEPHPAVLMRHAGDGNGWRDARTGDPA